MKRFLVAAVVAGLSTSPSGQSGFTVEQVLSHPFPADLIASPAGSTIAWTMNERGHRNIYVADGPDFRPRRITRYDSDEGQELTSLSFSDDGRFIVYVRGGDHGSNFPAEGNLQPNPTSSPIQPRMQVWSIAAAGGTPVLLGEGDEPVVAPARAIRPEGGSPAALAGRVAERPDPGEGGPSTRQVAFLNNRRIWVAPIDGSTPAAPMFFARGEGGSPAWSPDGSALAFVSSRGTHSYIGIFTSEHEPIRYIAPSTSRDSSPRWSPDGKRIAFVRQPGRGGPVPNPLEQQPQPWSLWVGDVAAATATEAWASGSKLPDSIPRTQGGPNLHWAAGDRLVFLSYSDGWPHLYSVDAATRVTAYEPNQATPPNQATLLTPGRFMVEYVALSPDRRTIVYNANAGPDANDVDRRHLFTVAVDAGPSGAVQGRPTQVTTGREIEWQPVVTGDGRTLAYFSSSVQRPGLPAVMNVAGGPPRVLAQDRIPAGFPSARLVTPEYVIVKAPDGAQVHCQMFKAAGGADKRPAVVFVHGGPPRQMLLGWHYMFYYANTYALNQYLASRGFVVLSVNYRLGIGYGHDFHYPDRAGVRGASEYQDVLAAGQYLKTRADVDPARVGIWGGSYGGYLAALALGRHSDVFAAGVDIHGVHRRQPSISLADAPGAMMDGVTEDALKAMIDAAWTSSPVSSVPTWTSPVLLIHGDDDRNVQFQQTVELSRRLKAKGVDVEELVIPDDIHDFLLFRNWTMVGRATGEYFEKKLMPRRPPTNSQ